MLNEKPMWWHWMVVAGGLLVRVNKGNKKITEHRAIFQRERQISYVNKQTNSVNNRKTGKTAMALSF
jgi:hypothetical protein